MALYPSNSETSLSFTITYDTAGVTTPAQLNFNKTRAAGAIADNDYIGRLQFYGNDGDSTEECALIEVRAVGTIADTRMPGQMTFWTRPDAPAGAITQRLTIATTGEVTIAAPDAGTGLTIAGGGLAVTGAILYTATTYAVNASAASATAIALEATNAAGGIRLRAGTGGITIGDQADTSPISIGDIAPTANRTITVGGGTVITAATTDTIDIGPDGATTNANSVKTVNVNTGGVTLGQVLTNIASGDVTSGTHTTAIASGNRAAGAMTLNVMTGTGTKTANVGNADGLTTVNIDAITLINDSINVQTSINTGTSTGAVVIGNALAGAMSMDTAAGISLDAATVSNFTVTGAGQDLNLQSVGGSVLVSSTENAADAIYLHANGGVLETIHLGVDQGTDPASVNLVSTAGGITLSAGLATADAINITATAGASGIDIDSGTAGIIADTTGAISLDAVLASNFTVTGAADLTVNTTLGSLVLQAGEAVLDSIQITTAAGGGIDINAGTTGLTIDSTDLLSIDAAGVTNLTTTGAFDLTVNSTAGSVIIDGGEAVLDAVQITSSNAAGGLDLNGGTGGITIDTTGGLSLDSATASNFTVTGGGQDLSLTSVGGSVIIDGSEAAANAITINASNPAGGINVDCGSAGFDLYAVGGPISIDAEGVTNFTTTGAFDMTVASTLGSVVVTAGEAVADAIQLTASNAAGGITMSTAAAGSIAVLDANGLRYPNVYRLNAVRTGGGHVVGAGNVVIFNTEGFDPGADYDNATGIYTVPVTGIYRISAVVNCTDVVGGGTKTVTLRDNGAATNYFSTATVGNTLIGAIAIEVLYSATAGHTLDIFFAGGAGDTADNGSTLNIEFAYSV